MYMKKVHVVVLKLLLFSVVLNLFMAQAQQSMSVCIVFFIKQTDIIILCYFWLFEIFLHLTEVLYSPSEILYL